MSAADRRNRNAADVRKNHNQFQFTTSSKSHHTGHAGSIVLRPQNSVLRLMLRCLGILFACILVGTLLMIAVFMLPSAPIQRHVYGSASLVLRTDKGQMINPNDPATQVDIFSDAIMVLNAAYDQGESPVELAMMGYRPAGSDPENYPMEPLTNPEISQGRKYAYPRYWHGYLVVLRPLLVIMGYGSVLMLNGGIQAALVVAIIILMARKGLEHLITPYLLITISIRPLVIANCLQDSSVFYVMSAAVLALLALGRSRLTRDHLVRIFLLTGILTSFFDLLSWPFVTFGVPATLAVAMGVLDMRTEKNAQPLGSSAHTLSSLCLLMLMLSAWGIGYGGMWVGKWVVGSVLTGTNVIADALGQASVRASDVVAGQELTLGAVYWKNLNAFLGGPYLSLAVVLSTGTVSAIACYRAPGKVHLAYALTILTCVGAIALSVATRWKDGAVICAIVLLLCLAATLVVCLGINSFQMERIACYAVLVILPFVWYAAMKNHSFIHTYLFTSRELAISLFAFLVFMMSLLPKPRLAN